MFAEAEVGERDLLTPAIQHNISQLQIPAHFISIEHMIPILDGS